MLPKVMEAYYANGFHVDLGNPARVYSTIVDIKAHKTVNTSGGFTISDAFLFTQLQRVICPTSIFIIGNSFGLSTFVLAELFPTATLDAIDAEIEGLEASRGTHITRQIAAQYFPNVQVTVGFSPTDLSKATLRRPYNLIFIDGMHTNEQVVLDFNGMLPYCDNECVIVFHDVAYANMLSAWQQIVVKAAGLGFHGFTMGFTQLGTCVLARGKTEALSFLALIANEFEGPYRTSFSATEGQQYRRRPFFWDMSFGYLEGLAQRKIRRILGRLG
jgi:predicted O-methyltransferase YrrM